MDVFLCWSGTRSKAVAQALKDWLPLVINAVEPWLSAEMDKGSRWDDEISTRLEKTKVGIICLTPENLEAKWIHFEAGALSKTKEARACTLLVDIKNPGDIEFPLAKFQATKPEKEEMRGLVRTINKLVGECGEKSLTEEHLNEAFTTYWPRLETQLKTAIQLSVTTRKIERSSQAMLQEILQLVRDQDRRLSQVERAGATTASEVTTIAGLLEEYRQLGLFRKFGASLADLKTRTTVGNAHAYATQDPLDVSPTPLPLSNSVDRKD
jgi:hypothetical protein